MEIKRSEIYKLKKQRVSDDNYFDRKNRVDYVKDKKAKRDEKIVVTAIALVGFFLALRGKTGDYQTTGVAMMLLSTLVGLWQ